MASRLAREIKQARGFASRRIEASLSIQRTADLLHRRLCATLRGDELSPAQYNVLRILRGQHRVDPTRGLPCSGIAERLLTWDPDITRLTDRLVARGLVERDRDPQDRRVVLVAITPSGLELLARLDAPVGACDAAGLGQLSDAQCDQLIELLDGIRERLDPELAPSSTTPAP